MKCNPQEIKSLLEIPTKFLNRVYHPGITVAAIALMLVVLTGVLWFLRYWYLDEIPSTADIRQIISNVCFFGGTMLTLWEVIQAGSRKRNLQALDEAAVLIKACESCIEPEFLEKPANNAISSEPVKHEVLMDYRKDERRLRQVFKLDIEFADFGAKFGVFIILGGLLLTPFT